MPQYDVKRMATGLRRFRAGDTITESRMNSLVDSINNNASYVQRSQEGAVRLAQTMADNNPYPSLEDNPNVFAFKWIYLDPGAQAHLTYAGRVSLTAASGSTVPDGYVINIAATGEHDPSGYIPEGTIITVSPAQQGFYFTFFTLQRLYRFELKESFATGEADADIYEMTGALARSAVTLNDPEHVFDTLGEGDRGYCEYQDGRWWAIQAPCPDEGSV